MQSNNILSFIGNTPLVELGRLSSHEGVSTPVMAKVEFFNPGGSVKDRVALALVNDAERRGLLTPGATIIEPTSGNTGIGLALVAAVKGYKLILTMPETMSIERRKLVAAYGAEVRLTPAAEGMGGAVKAAESLQRSIPGSVILGQFDNQANPQCHYDTTGREIWEQTGGNIDAFVACVGTGGTISGTGRRLKEYNHDIKIIAVEPASSPLLSAGHSGPHKIQGIGANFIPKTYDAGVVDEVVTVTDAEAMRTARLTASNEGLLVGISSGAALAAALAVAKRLEYSGKRIVTLLPDTGERYLSTELFNI
ncbi:cysteine synthase [Prevotella sp. CAG:1124]|nr:cysteine synthase [Prevotella sp. CAG:1124]